MKRFYLLIIISLIGYLLFSLDKKRAMPIVLINGLILQKKISHLIIVIHSVMKV